MEQLLAFLDRTLLPPLTRVAQQKELRAVRDGIVSILPLIIVGSLFLLLGSLPLAFIPKELAALLLLPYRLTMGLMSLYASFTVAHALAGFYNIPPLSCGLASMATFLLTTIPLKVPLAEGGKGEWILPLSGLGGQGLFVAIVFALLSTQVCRICLSRDLLKMPAGVPPAVTQAFSAVLPTGVLVILLWVVRVLMNLNLHSILLQIFRPLEILGDTFVAVILINLLLHLVWLTGIHGVSVINAVFLTVWLTYLEKNAAAHAAGVSLPYITAHPFYQWFVWVGGSGTTLGLMFLLLRSRSSQLRQLGKLAFLPGICNINEPIIFGMPIVMNPLLAIPFILAPLIASSLAYASISLGLVNRPYVYPPWTLPAPIGCWLATGGDWRALVLLGVILTVTTFLYLPFVRSYERQLLAQEEEDKREA